MSYDDPSRTLLECFEDALPLYRTGYRLEQTQKTTIASSSRANKQVDMKAPRYLITLRPTHWTDLADTILANPDVRSKLSKKQVYGWEDTNLKSEQDVVDLVGKFAVTPVLVAINIVSLAPQFT